MSKSVPGRRSSDAVSECVELTTSSFWNFSLGSLVVGLGTDTEDDKGNGITDEFTDAGRGGGMVESMMERVENREDSDVRETGWLSLILTLSRKRSW